MDRLRIYTGVLVATKRGEATEVQGFTFTAHSTAEAIGNAVDRMGKKWPGYSIQVGPFEAISDSVIVEVAYSLGMVESSDGNGPNPAG